VSLTSLELARGVNPCGRVLRALNRMLDSIAASQSAWERSSRVHDVIAHVFHATSEGLVSYGYFAIFAVILLESAGVPLPGETMLIGASIYAGSHQELEIRLIIATAAGAAILGDNVGYWIGRGLGRRLPLSWGHWIDLDPRKLDLGEYLFLRYGGKIIFLARFVAVLRVIAAVLAGVNRVPPWRFLVFNALGGNHLGSRFRH